MDMNFNTVAALSCHRTPFSVFLAKKAMLSRAFIKLLGFEAWGGGNAIGGFPSSASSAKQPLYAI
jgi:hypothetical protein